MRRFSATWLCVTVLLLSVFHRAPANQFQPHTQRFPFLSAPASAFGYGLAGFVNPALPGSTPGSNLLFFWQSPDRRALKLGNWGIFASFPGFGFGTQSIEQGPLRVRDYKISLSGGESRAFRLGLGYGWSTGDKGAFGHENYLSLGGLFRPHPALNLGITGNLSTESNAREAIVELGLRPLLSPRLTLFADWSIQRDQSLKDTPWSIGAALEPVRGIQLVGRYFDDKSFSLALHLNIGYGGISTRADYNADGDYQRSTHALRLGEFARSFVSEKGERNRYLVAIDLTGRVDYQKYLLLDRRTHRLLEVLRTIRLATEDPRVEAIAVNLSSARMLPEHAWEIRRELQRARGKGKKVLVYLDNAGMTEYHLASVADVIFMDPMGNLLLPGYRMGRTFFKGTLEKLGLGFDEWRFFKYKSAAEVLSRDRMSEADREQRQKYLDDVYEQVARDVIAGRGWSRDKWERIINKEGFLRAEVALSEGLVDTLARWSALDKVVEQVTGRKHRRLKRKALLDRARASQRWGEPPHVAVVYGLGVCAMDEGINARELERVFKKLEKDPQVKAVVFRVDSPGGDGMASDVVAAALAALKKKKPVVVSQGQVAGSGGYWISMNASKILAGPQTVTGSIGVIGGWLYDRGFSAKLGMSSDLVKRGEHADLGFGVQLPVLGVQIPARNLTPEEFSIMEKNIKSFYRTFVHKVSQARGLRVTRVDSLAQGRIYSGTLGKAIGLVDDIGGLMDAVDLARKLAGIPERTPIELEEHRPYKGLFPIPGVAATEANVEETVAALVRFLATNSGKPMPMLDLESAAFYYFPAGGVGEPAILNY
ncbi:MAG: signal peptide peptidase SppA [Calditrichaeota bacterium]|nr:MAG: signal peptide peptidase SppA [Calditrichota bacterium]